MPEPYGSATRWSPMFSRQQVGGMFHVQDLSEHPGNVWFVDSTHASASDASGPGPRAVTAMVRAERRIEIAPGSAPRLAEQLRGECHG